MRVVVAVLGLRASSRLRRRRGSGEDDGGEWNDDAERRRREYGGFSEGRFTAALLPFGGGAGNDGRIADSGFMALQPAPALDEDDETDGAGGPDEAVSTSGKDAQSTAAAAGSATTSSSPAHASSSHGEADATSAVSVGAGGGCELGRRIDEESPPLTPDRSKAGGWPARLGVADSPDPPRSSPSPAPTSREEARALGLAPAMMTVRMAQEQVLRVVYDDPPPELSAADLPPGLARELPVPQTVAEALSGPHAAWWAWAMRAELGGHLKVGTFRSMDP